MQMNFTLFSLKHYYTSFDFIIFILIVYVFYTSIHVFI